MSIIPAMELDVEAGAELDIGINDNLSVERCESLARIDSLVTFSATAAGSPKAVDCGGPAMGRIWAIHRVCAAPYPLAVQASTDTSQMYLVALPGGYGGINEPVGVAGVPLASLTDTGFPMNAQWGRFELYVTYPMHLWVILFFNGSGFPNTVNGSVGIVDYHNASYIESLPGSPTRKRDIPTIT